ncbi:MAG: Response regulator [Massilia sp.]|jgi:two-component system chemotaxis response regulator CheY|nr:Response regulator [Massilia sp.]
MKVLVVDDDVVSRMVLMHQVDSCGAYEIYEAEDGLDAWEQLQEGLRPAILFCDLRMPRWSGMELLERVKADRAYDGMRFILASSASDHLTMATANSLGADGYIVKPFEQDMVRAQMGGLASSADDVESPLATLARLGIGSERLQAYLGGFEVQLEAAVVELGAVTATGNGADADAVADIRARIAQLHAGCVTLGLAGSAAGLDALATGALEGARVQAALAAALATVREQGERVRRMRAAD